jgi:hypothetical protein
MEEKIMSTQGLLSIIKNKQVVLKVVVFSDGDRMERLAEWLLENSEAQNKELLEQCELLFSRESLVIQQTATHYLHRCSYSDWRPNSLYEEKFNDPKYYPCEEFDMANYTYILDCTDKPSVIFAEGFVRNGRRSELSEHDEKPKKESDLIAGLKLHLVRLLEEEKAALDADNQGFYSGLCFARVNLEAVLESHGYSRTTTIDG